MIELLDISDSPTINGHTTLLATNVTLDIPPGRYALLSHNPFLARHAIDLFSSVRPPARGEVIVQGIPSWAIGRAAFIRGKVTGLEAVALVSRIYALDQNMCFAIMKEMMTNPSLLHERIEHWPTAMRHEFGHAVALLPSFDIYFVDGALPFGRTRYYDLWRSMFEERRKGSSLILSTTRANEAREYCDQAIVLDRGTVEIHDDLDYALSKYPPRPAGAMPMTAQPTGTQNNGDLLF